MTGFGSAVAMLCMPRWGMMPVMSADRDGAIVSWDVRTGDATHSGAHGGHEQVVAPAFEDRAGHAQAFVVVRGDLFLLDAVAGQRPQCRVGVRHDVAAVYFGAV